MYVQFCSAAAALRSARHQALKGIEEYWMLVAFNHCLSLQQRC
jgi:hypothetical protein